MEHLIEVTLPGVKQARLFRSALREARAAFQPVRAITTITSSDLEFDLQVVAGILKQEGISSANINVFKLVK